METISTFPIKEEPELNITADDGDDTVCIDDHDNGEDEVNFNESGEVEDYCPAKINYEPYITKVYDKSKTRFYQCNFCSKSYHKKHSLKLHIRSIHMLLKPFPCKICHKSFTAKNVLIQHVRTHSGERPYECPVCSKTFVQHSVWNRHKRTHSKETPYSCDVCSKAFIDRSSLHQHIKIHTAERSRRYKCNLCSESFLKNSHLSRHRLTKSHRRRELVQDGFLVYDGELNRRFSCELCNVSFVKSSHLVRHNSTNKHQKEVTKRGSALDIKSDIAKT